MRPRLLVVIDVLDVARHIGDRRGVRARVPRQFEHERVAVRCTVAAVQIKKARNLLQSMRGLESSTGAGVLGAAQALAL